MFVIQYYGYAGQPPIKIMKYPSHLTSKEERLTLVHSFGHSSIGVRSPGLWVSDEGGVLL